MFVWRVWRRERERERFDIFSGRLSGEDGLRGDTWVVWFGGLDGEGVWMWREKRIGEKWKWVSVWEMGNMGGEKR